MTIAHELISLDTINSLELLLTLKTLGHGHKALDPRNNLGL